MSRRGVGWLLAGVLTLGCGAAPRSRALLELDALRATPASQEAERLAPQAFARAEQLRGSAEDAQREGDPEAARVLAEHAAAAYQRAFILARLARAEERRTRAEQELTDARRAFAKLEAARVTATAAADATELRVKVLRDQLPLVESEPATPEREAARLEAARALAWDARLYCTAAQLLQSAEPSLPTKLGALDTLDAALSKRPTATPIDEALRLRSGCLAELTQARRAASARSPAEGVADQLLSELSAVPELEPSRDERGVVVTLRGLFAGPRLSAEGARLVASLGRTAKAHPRFPVLVLLHSSGAAGAVDAERGQRLLAALRAEGAEHLELRQASGARPLLPPRRTGAAAYNERVELVFVSPTN